MNNITVYGRLGRDAELKDIKGTQVLELSVCQCQKKSESEAGKAPVWWKVTYWQPRYDKILQYLKKGTAVIVSGEMTYPECYQTKTEGWTVGLKIRGSDLKFNPFGGERKDNDNDQKATNAEVIYPHEFQPKKETNNEDLGDLF